MSFLILIFVTQFLTSVFLNFLKCIIYPLQLFIWLLIFPRPLSLISIFLYLNVCTENLALGISYLGVNVFNYLKSPWNLNGSIRTSEWILPCESTVTMLLDNEGVIYPCGSACFLSYPIFTVINISLAYLMAFMLNGCISIGFFILSIVLDNLYLKI